MIWFQLRLMSQVLMAYFNIGRPLGTTAYFKERLIFLLKDQPRWETEQ